MLWTDSRYWQQAEQQLPSSISLKKQGVDPDMIVHLGSEERYRGKVVAVEADMLSLAMQKQLQAAFLPQNMVLKTDVNVLAQVWHDRPALPNGAIFEHKAQYVAESTAQKLARIRQKMADWQADYHLISSLDDIAWLCNLRGNDVPYNPVFLSYVLMSFDSAILFVEPTKLNQSHITYLKNNGIEVKNYDAVGQVLGELSGVRLLIDENKTAVSTLFRLPESSEIVFAANPSSLFKSQKSPEEIANIRQAMREDGGALCDCFAELERDMAAGQILTELDIDRRLIQHRSQRPDYISPSFNTIAGFQANGALPHYAATEASHRELVGNGLLLIDSGAQYHNGTTDITRVMAIGTVGKAEKRDFTLVLKAHIALAQAVFPANVSGAVVDAICRAPLWQAQRDYGHGTGHGIGYCLNVHEFPATIAYRAPANPNNILKVGQVVSNEPALYREGQYGIRIENVLVCQAFRQPEETVFGEFSCFETLTLFPIDTRLVLTELLTQSERDWLNQYHACVREQLLPLVAQNTRDWLIARTEAV